MHEALFLKLIEAYENGGQSASRVIRDPQFKTIPLEERVALLKKYGPRIRANMKMDSTFWKDLAVGSVGLAIAAGPVAKAATESALAGGRMRDEFDETGVFNPTGHMPKITLADVSILGIGTKVGYGPASNAYTFMKDRGLVKKYLSNKPDQTTTDNAIDVIART